MTTRKVPHTDASAMRDTARAARRGLDARLDKGLDTRSATTSRVSRTLRNASAQRPCATPLRSAPAQRGFRGCITGSGRPGHGCADVSSPTDTVAGCGLGYRCSYPGPRDRYRPAAPRVPCRRPRRASCDSMTSIEGANRGRSLRLSGRAVGDERRRFSSRSPLLSTSARAVIQSRPRRRARACRQPPSSRSTSPHWNRRDLDARSPVYKVLANDFPELDSRLSNIVTLRPETPL